MRYIPSMTVSMKHFDKVSGNVWVRRKDEWFDHVKSIYRYENDNWLISYLDGEAENLGDDENKYEFNFANLEQED